MFLAKQVVNPRSRKILVLSASIPSMFKATLVHEGDMGPVTGVFHQVVPGGILTT